MTPDLPKTAPEPKEGLHLKRPCLLVADLERALTIYQDILGFRLDYVAEASATSYLYKVFQIPAQATLTFATLSTERELRAIALTEVKGIELPRPTPPYPIGIVIQVSDLAMAIQQIQSLELEVVQPSYFTAPPNLAFTEQGFYDFDGHLIILYEVKVLSENHL
ncbi:MAG: VOC family protein [Leptolyngbyaceae cyanobacterium RU_5_1]|nr:VOC family protein [Leptolyngbyaceae cyanobacterium RU_5_1]